MRLSGSVLTGIVSGLIALLAVGLYGRGWYGGNAPAPPPPLASQNMTPPYFPDSLNSIKGNGPLLLVFASAQSEKREEQMRFLESGSALLDSVHIRVAFIKLPFEGKLSDSGGMPEVSLTQYALSQAESLFANVPNHVGFAVVLAGNDGREVHSWTTPVTPQEIAHALVSYETERTLKSPR